MKALAERDGVMGISSWPVQLKRGNKLPTIHDYLDHIDYAVRLMGIDHVALGPDLAAEFPSNNIKYHTTLNLPQMGQMMRDSNLHLPWVPELDSIEKLLPNVVNGLVSRGYSDDEIKKIAGGNLLRVFRTVFGS